MDTQAFNGKFGKIANGMCRITINGNIAIKTSSGYKTYSVKNGTLTNVNNFCFDLGCDFFFVMPTMKVKAGDIILVDGKPKCVIEATKKIITAIDYETSEIKQIVPERHVFMGNVFFYGKIVSLLGNGLGCGKKGGFFKNMLKLKMMSSMMGGEGGSGFGGNGLAMMMLMGNGSMDGLFDGFDEDGEDDDEDGDAFTLFDDSENEDEEDAPKAKAKKAKKAAVRKPAKKAKGK